MQFRLAIRSIIVDGALLKSAQVLRKKFFTEVILIGRDPAHLVKTSVADHLIVSSSHLALVILCRHRPASTLHCSTQFSRFLMYPFFHTQLPTSSHVSDRVFAQMPAAGNDFTCILTSDGRAVAFGQNIAGQCWLPALRPGERYVQVSCGGEHTVLLRSDGTADACGLNRHGQCNIPPLPVGVTYAQVSAGYYMITRCFFAAMAEC